MPSCLRSGRITASANLRLLQQEDRGVTAVTAEKLTVPRAPFAGKNAPGDHSLTMEVLYQLSYVGASQDPTALTTLL